MENNGNELKEISNKAFIDESEHVKMLLSQVGELRKADKKIYRRAKKLVEEMPPQAVLTDIQSFLAEYKLNTNEGVAVMCIAEALLRIPDAKTADRLIRDKLSGKEWKKHVGKSSSAFVNASSWGLMITGKLSDMGSFARKKEGAIFGNLASKMGEPVIRKALKAAMAVIGRQFIMGENILDAKKRAKKFEDKGYMISYDMLGEGARSSAAAEKYFNSYINSLKEINKGSISIKLSSLHPRYELLQHERVMAELVPKVKEIMLLAMKKNIMVAIDAEESARLDISMMVFSQLMADRSLLGFEGMGFVLQAYQKRAFFVIDWLLELSKTYKKKIPIRLVKGAYWDSEIKLAQMGGFSSYPVFTKKEHTDVSYLACAAKILHHEKNFYPQFATHNALTIAAIMEIAKGKDFEFQRLRGMGGALYANVISKIPCRVYAPVGEVEELLPYLIRRLLENGANTSFVHLLADKDTPIYDLLRDPIKDSENHKAMPNKNTPLPQNLYGDRKNSWGIDFGNMAQMNEAWAEIEKWQGKKYQAENATANMVEEALNKAEKAFPQWNETAAKNRAAILENIADRIEENRYELIALCMNEAKKTFADSWAEVREAADFCRYYASSAKKLFKNKKLKGAVGEDNIYSLHGRGVFLCISPWNFPLAIFTGQVAAALAAGNSVIAKPAEQTPLIAALAVKIMYEAGVPKDVLHLLVGDGDILGTALVKAPQISAVAFTGGTKTAKIINRNLAARAGAIIPLIAETGGQNCMVADSSVLLEQTVDDIIASAFGSAGQRCSALRVLYVQEEIADSMLTILAEAMAELKLGNPFDMATDIGPVIDAEAKENLEKHIAEMKKEAKLICKVNAPEDGNFIAPHVFEIDSINRLKQENFGPILHVIRYKSGDIKKVTEQINSTGFGLTLGVQSRVSKTADIIIGGVRAGNCYVNRSMTGSVVGVQPFGGEGLSGTGFKAGGPNYLLRFVSEKTVTVNSAAVGGSIELLS